MTSPGTWASLNGWLFSPSKTSITFGPRAS